MVNFYQDEVPAYTSAMAQQICEAIFPNFIRKDRWPGDSPDLNPIENLFTIFDQ